MITAWGEVKKWIQKAKKLFSAAKTNFDLVKSGAVTWDEINVNYRTFSLNFGVRAGTQEDYDWNEEQMYEGDDFRTFATALSWMTDTVASIPVIERVRLR